MRPPGKQLRLYPGFPGLQSAFRLNFPVQQWWLVVVLLVCVAGGKGHKLAWLSGLLSPAPAAPAAGKEKRTSTQGSLGYITKQDEIKYFNVLVSNN